VKPFPRPDKPSWLVLIACLLVCFGVWRWAEGILAPANTTQALAQGRPIGNNSDLYPRWLGSRELLLHRRDPYSPGVTREIQTGFYGRPLNPQRPSDPAFPESFVYPLYVVFLLAPTITLPFGTVQEIFRWFLLLGLASSVPLWMYAIGFRSKPLLVLSGMVLVLSSSAAIAEYHQQNLAALVVLFLAAAAAAAARNWLVLAGFLLALATIKPELSGLSILWFLLWAAARWTERKRLTSSFMITMTALLVAADVVSPHWVGRFFTALREYPTYGTDPSILQAILPPLLADFATAGLVSFLVLYCWRARKAPAGAEQFGWALAAVASVTLTVLPKLAAYNQALLVPALVVLLAHREVIAKARLLPRALAKAPFLCLLWQWATAVILSLSSVLVPPSRLQFSALVPEYTLLALPPIVLLAVVANVGAGFPARAASP
jgi:hypothetical protein